MSLYGSFLSEEQFQCSICLDVFTNPSSTPCGHSFCMRCISRYWDEAKVFRCPLCKKTFEKRPDLQINRTLREITDQFKSMKSGDGAVKKKSGGKGSDGKGSPSSHLFDELKRKLHRPVTKTHQAHSRSLESDSFSASFSLAKNSQASSVPNDSMTDALNHTNGAPAFHRSHTRRRFTLSAAEMSQNVPLCEIHNSPILIYCRSDQMLLTMSEQKIQDMIRERISKIEKIKMSVTDLELAVDRETAGSMCLLSSLVSSIERSQAELLEVMEISRRAAQRQAESMTRQLEQEIEELRRRENELTKLAQSDDHVHCVKTFPILASPPPTRNWSTVSVNTDLGTESIYKSLAAQVEKFYEELKNIAEKGFLAIALDHSPARTQPMLKRLQEYALDVTLDSNTSHPRLVLSQDLKSVRCGERYQLVSDNPERFDKVVCVMGREAISSGKHYWEVDVCGKTDWDLGVVRYSVNRKGKIEYTPDNGFWFLSLRDKSKYAFRSQPYTDVQMNLQPQKIGIFVDFENGQVSFYNVDAKIHIYTFTDIFSETIYPFFSPCTSKSGRNDLPLIITPVKVTE
ncbi:E3 ubiquitin-protein ligase TRIM39 isoform X2 [Archocentrus centrarchus]|uniref:E3 ubiquitin-protein ligase TRIM39 isoform X2 n=1 Tax=Archocentrus centrarchus TaxID=63155 RepID=UPI0011EA4EC7|nr:E3 ubiquitin-protein ligase TRIM39-like isoform X2 [Archocentrus centrarchus]